MEYLALYRKYRPTKFSDVVDQENTLKILTNSLKEGHISHAYLFSGPRGTGKTTIAKLVAKTINCLDLNDDFSVCGKCENCLDILNNSPDIIEIDAASNNGVDEIRDLKSKINLVPNKLKYKVYIIDEVHMLSISAFNALLKTIEEPPSHVIFILATTEFYKVPTTIISRCQCLNFTRIKTSSIEHRLREIADLEHINIEDEAIHEIAEYSEGGLRDALGMLDKLASYSLNKITTNDFLKINGLISKQDMDEFIKQIINKENEKVIKTLNKFDELGYDFSKLLEKLMQECRDLMVFCYQDKSDKSLDPHELYNLIMCFNEIYNLLKEAINRKIIVEVKLLKFMNAFNETKKSFFATEVVEESPSNISREISHDLVVNKESRPTVEIKNIKKEEKNSQNKILKYSVDLDTKKIRINNTFALASKMLKNIALDKWKKLDDYLVSTEYSYVAGLLKDTTIGVVSKNNIILTAKYDTLIDDIYSNFDKVIELISKIMENSIKIVLLTTDEFKIEVNNYKEHMKDDGYYEYKEEIKPFINYKEIIEKKEDLSYTNLVDKALDAFGTEIVEIE
ncbi:MAG: DNA polymerase III subunit gamma/tau [Bacilli bacterium]|nr:DNA polymerase III subunit gamma/tau [Bacilli bacterium]